MLIEQAHSLVDHTPILDFHTDGAFAQKLALKDDSLEVVQTHLLLLVS